MDQKPHEYMKTKFAYDWDSSPYSDLVLSDSESYGSTLTSPISPASCDFTLNFSSPCKEEALFDKSSKQAFDFGTFEDWMQWDDNGNAALSPTSNFFTTFKLEPLSPTMRDIEFNGIENANLSLITLEESEVFGEDPIIEEPLFETEASRNILDTAQPERLYSTPLSWTRPTYGKHNFNTTLSPEEEFKLRSIAMPHLNPQNSASLSTTSSPEPEPEIMRKRKQSIGEDIDEEDESELSSHGRHVKKTAHNMIEKRYRTNLNDKIAALKEAVPSLRAVGKMSSALGGEVKEDLQGLTPAHKLNKATVLSKATEYITHLEERSSQLSKENVSLNSRIDAFEILIMSRLATN